MRSLRVTMPRTRLLSSTIVRCRSPMLLQSKETVSGHSFESSVYKYKFTMQA